jgi:hypothetical protein
MQQCPAYLEQQAQCVPAQDKQLGLLPQRQVRICTAAAMIRVYGSAAVPYPV